MLISPLAQVAENHELTSSFTNITKQPLQRKSVFPLDEIGELVSTFNTFGVAQLLVHYHHRFHRWLLILKSFGLGTQKGDVATTRLNSIKELCRYKDFATMRLISNQN